MLKLLLNLESLFSFNFQLKKLQLNTSQRNGPLDLRQTQLYYTSASSQFNFEGPSLYCVWFVRSWKEKKSINCKKDLRLLYFCLQGTKCCDYGADGKKIVTSKGGYDCILIPGASLAGAIKPDKICGNNMGLVTVTGTTSATVCCKFLIDHLIHQLGTNSLFYPKSLYITCDSAKI